MPIMARTRAQSYDPYSDWGTNSKGQQVNAMGQRKTIGYSPDRIPARGFGGLNEHYIRNSYDGTPKAIDAAAQEARKAGALIDRNGQRMADTWENRGFKTHLSDKNPYAQPAGPVPPPAVPSLPPGAPSADNRAFAEKGAPKGGGGGGGVAPVAPRPVAGRTLNNQDWANQPAPKGGGGGKSAPAAPVPAAAGDDGEGGEAPAAEEPTGGESSGEGDSGGEPAPQPEPEPDDAGLLKVEMPTPNRALIPPAPPPMGNDNSGQAAPGYQGAGGQDLTQAMAGMQSKPSPQPINRASANPYSFEEGDSPELNQPPSPTATGTPVMARGDSDWPVSGLGGDGNVTDPQQPVRAATTPYPSPFDPQSSADNKNFAATKPTNPPPVSPFQARADEIAAQRDFDRGEAPVTFDRPGNGVSQDGQGLMVPSPLRATKINPYGTATATFGGPPTTGGTMEDPLTGATVPIKQWTNDQSAVQATKYGPGAAQAGENYFGPKKTQGQVDANRYVDTAISAAQAGENYFGPKKTQGQVDANRYVDTAISAVPLGQDDAEQYRAIARGGKIPRSPK